MEKILERWLAQGKKNFVFLGEAGSGKSEIAMNIAIGLKQATDRPVHFFDLDQTKPLFRSRDAKTHLEEAGVQFHYEEQFFDAPTSVGGVREQLADENSIVVMDVGGNHQGARLIGGYAPFLNQHGTEAFFVINPYRPWSKDVESIDGTLSSILKVSHIQQVSIISNPNLGTSTTIEEIITGNQKVEEMIGEYIHIGYISAMENLCEQLTVPVPILPIKLYLTSPWNGNE
ncbi:hypothetical protein M2140_001077 [Clostridiales Family XIII bacterium PM5-7]